MTTSIIELSAAPVQVNSAGHSLGAAGRSIRLTNAGDNPVYWWIAAQEPVGVPGFSIARGGAHELTLPDMALWAWTRGTTRLLATPLGNEDDVGVVPGTSSAIPLGQTPVAAMAPHGAERGTRMLAVAAGDPVHVVSGGVGAPPSPLVPETTLSLGESILLVGGDDGTPPQTWWWTDAHLGATVLLTVADGRWSL